ncbi:MAG: hypothetical protein GX319_01980 [Clostridiales bacterium]|nr:hypothetical protein [Bacillota bacterium]NLK03161.1 hypothetical protein [Clostridiales bacterium]
MSCFNCGNRADNFYRRDGRYGQRIDRNRNRRFDCQSRRCRDGHGIGNQPERCFFPPCFRRPY